MENISTHLSGFRATQPSFFTRMLAGLMRLDAAHRQAQALKRLDGHLRADVGLADWDAPTIMRRK